MLRTIEAVQFVGRIGSGKTDPAIVVGETIDGQPVEVVAKFASACERGKNALACEVIAACLAGDLGLPIPEPFILEITPEWRAVVPADYRHKIRDSDSKAFGSKFISPQWPTWTQGHRVTEPMAESACAVFAFDAWIDNVDRRDGNSNCLVSGDQIRIFDHELAWPTLLFAKRPWIIGGLESISQPGNHIFRRELIGRALNFTAIRDSWANLKDDAISEYGATVPAEWVEKAFVDDILIKIREVRDNIDQCIDEFRRVLT